MKNTLLRGEIDSCVEIALYGLLLPVVLIIWIIGSYFEARAFNVCTGGNAGVSTAMFTELRVTDCKK